MTDETPKQPPALRVVQTGDVIEPTVVDDIVPMELATEREMKSAFLGVLAETASVLEACKVVGISRVEAHQWRKDPAFDRAWNQAYTIARSVIIDAAVDRALVGTARPILDRYGEVKGWVRTPSDAVLSVLLKEPHLLNS